MAAAAILDFKNFAFLTIGTVKKYELRHCAKFCQNRSNHGGDISVFDFSRWRRRYISSFDNMHVLDFASLA